MSIADESQSSGSDVGLTGGVTGMVPRKHDFKPQGRPPEATKNIALLVYILQAVSFLFLVTALIGVIINYVKRSEVRGTWVESHFRWQIRTFWFTLLWSLIGMLLIAVYIGILVLFANVIWFIYRIVRGWLNLNENRAMYQKV